MSYQLIFETGMAQTKWFDVFLGLIFFAIFAAAFGANPKNGGYGGMWKVKKFWLGAGVCLAVELAALGLTYRDYKAYVVPYEAGQYRSVEGAVADYTVSGSAEKEDSFTVNGVAFSYKTNSGSNYRYHLSGAGGGAVSADGQQVRIGYVTGGDGVNSIVKLEVAK